MSKPKRRGRPKLRTPKKALTIRLPRPYYVELSRRARATDTSVGGLASEMLIAELRPMDPTTAV